MPDTIYGTADVGYVGSYMWRKPYNVMEKVFRSTLMARGTHPYVLIVDDIKKDSSAQDYRWQMALPDDVQIDSQSGRDIVLGRASDPSGAKLLVRVIEANDASGNTPSTVAGSLSATTVNNYDSNVLHISVNSIEPKFKVLLYPYQSGESLPSTSLSSDQLSITLPDQSNNLISFSAAGNGRTVISGRSASASLATNPTHLSFDATTGHTPAATQSEVVNLSSQIDVSQDWSASSNQTWLSLSPTSGSLSAGENTNITASLANSAYVLAAGTHIAQITIASDQDAFDRIVAVTLIVTEPFSVDPSSATFRANLDDVQSLAQTLSMTSHAPVSQDWTASSNQSWLSLSAENGTTAADASSDLVLTVSNDVYSYAADDYTAVVTLTSSIGAGVIQIPVTLLVRETASIPTEAFSNTNLFDLDNKQLTFVPAGNGYTVYVNEITELPNTAVANDELTGAAPNADYGGRDDAYWTFTPAWQNLTHVAGKAIGSELHLGTNGLISFDATPQYKYSQTSTSSHFGGHQISALLNDLDAGTHGQLYYTFTPGDRAIITFDSIPQYSSSNVNTFQIEIFDDDSGIIRISYLQVDANDAVVGISGGAGTPSEWPDGMIDFSSLDEYTPPTPLPELSLQLVDAQTSEWGTPSDSAQVRILSDLTLTEDLSANLTLAGTATSSDYTGTLTGGAHSITSGQSQLNLTAQAIDDSEAEGSETIEVTLATGTGYTVGSPSVVSITVLDKPYDQWRHSNNATTILEIDDSDGDGIPALVEYALGTNLSTPDSGYSMVADMTAKAVTITLDNPIPSDVDLTAEWSTNLSAWSSDNVSINGQEISITGFTGNRIFIKLLASAP
jgi:hypothetical protein